MPMAKVWIRYSCGHEQFVQVYGTAAIRKKKIRYLERFGDCDDCIEKKRAKQVKEAQEKSFYAGLPLLQGTPKQIAWAEQIRSQKITELEEWLAIYGRNTLREEDEAKACLSYWKGIQKASEWIACRNHSIRAMIRAYGDMLCCKKRESSYE